MSKQKKIFETYRGKLVREGWIKSALAATIVFFAVDFLVALISWLTGFGYGLWLALGLGLAVGGGSCPLFYFRLFRPTTKEVARRIDKLGFEERTLTMLELQNDTSYIAMRQREDAREQLRLAAERAKTLKRGAAAVGAEGATLKFTMSSALRNAVICGMSVFGALSIAASTMCGLSAYADLSYPGENAEERFVEVTYEVQGDGEIDGDILQILYEGDVATPVMAVASDGWMFTGWDDGYGEPYREEGVVTESKIITAIFEQMTDGTGGDGDSDGMGGDPGKDGEEGDLDPDQPSKGDGSAGNNGESGDGQGDGNNQTQGDGNGGDSGIEGGNGQGNGAGGRYEPGNSVINGKDYYRDYLDEYMQAMREKLESDDGSLTDEDRAFLEKYFGML